MSPVLGTYAALLLAIVCEVIATSFLPATQQFTRLWPTLATVLFYAAAFYFLSISLRTLPVGIAYAVWSGLGIILISVAGYVLYRQVLDLPAIIGIALILSGVIVINLFSESVGH